MRTVSFQSVLFGIATRMGLTPGANFQKDQAAAYTEYINSGLRKYWDWYDWSELSTVQERFYRLDWSAGTTYAAGDEVYDPGTQKYYVSLQGTNLAHAISDGAWWEVQAEFDPYISLQQSGEDEIGEVWGCYRRNPRIHDNPGKIDFYLSDNGVQVEPCGPASVWLHFQLPCPVFTTEPWNALTAYAKDAIVYSSPEGDCFRALTTVTGTVVTDTTKWKRISFPWVLSEIVKAQGYAEALAEDGQGEKALVQENRAMDKAQDERDREELRTGNASRWGKA